MVTLRPWQPEDRPLLDRFNTPAMTAHLVGPETEEELEKRHRRYLQRNRPGGMLVICDGDIAVGSIGSWEIEEPDGSAWETGWSVLPEHQGRGHAGQALHALLELVRADGRHREIHAYPAAGNARSNALCRRAGFTLLRSRSFPFRGSEILSNDWVLEL